MILSKSEAMTVSDAWCALNAIGAWAIIQGGTFLVIERTTGEIVVSGHSTEESKTGTEKYARQHEFLVAYGLKTE
jgi:hypothetical protein